MSNEHRMRRRQFLANLLFAGGVLTLAGLQSAQAEEHPADGWTLPDLNEPSPKTPPTPTPPPPRPPELPQPPTAGVPRLPGDREPPNPRGGIRVPQPPREDK